MVVKFIRHHSDICLFLGQIFYRKIPYFNKTFLIKTLAELKLQYHDIQMSFHPRPTFGPQKDYRVVEMIF